MYKEFKVVREIGTNNYVRIEYDGIWYTEDPYSATTFFNTEHAYSELLKNPINWKDNKFELVTFIRPEPIFKISERLSRG